MQFLENGIQDFLAEAGEAGCYSLCLVEIASRYKGVKLNVIDALKLGVEKGFILYNSKDRNDNNNFYVNDPAGFLGALTGKKWRVYHDSPDHRQTKGQYIVNRWERIRTGATLGHFEMKDFHPIANSLCVKYGAIKSVRVCEVIE